MSGMTTTISVKGMTCENCVRHVTEALREVPGVYAARVDLAAGTADIDADRHIPRDELSRALDEAGYVLA